MGFLRLNFWAVFINPVKAVSLLYRRLKRWPFGVFLHFLLTFCHSLAGMTYYTYHLYWINPRVWQNLCAKHCFAFFSHKKSVSEHRGRPVISKRWNLPTIKGGQAHALLKKLQLISMLLLFTQIGNDGKVQSERGGQTEKKGGNGVQDGDQIQAYCNCQ